VYIAVSVEHGLRGNAMGEPMQRFGRWQNCRVFDATVFMRVSRVRVFRAKRS
jgi:hypothetical protein